MEKNDFLLYNEVVYRLHACQTMEEFKNILLAQLKFVLPYTYGSFITIQTNPETRELIYRDLYCRPREFEEGEKRWLGRIDQAHTIWLGHAPESTVVRDSEIFSGDSRLSMPCYREFYQQYQIYDCIQMNVIHAGQVLGRLNLYRTRADGLFTEKEAFFLRALANHINLACWRCSQVPQAEKTRAQTLQELIQAHGLTRREGEVLALIFQDLNNEEILARLVISRNTLLKHLQNLYRKCGVSSRWDLRKLGG